MTSLQDLSQLYALNLLHRYPSKYMKTLLTLIILILTALGCSNKETPKDEKIHVADTQEKVDIVFRQVSDFPIIKDSTKFIADLRETFELEVDESPFQKANEKITVYRKVKIYGSDKDYFFIEYDYGDGAGVLFPWKYQLLLTRDGKLVETLSGQRFEFVEIFKNENPLLLTVVGTSKGNGGHQLYKISADTLENVFEGYYDYHIRTYDAHQDHSVFEPNELKIEISDQNKDGFNDIIFSGHKVMLVKYTKDALWYNVENGHSFTVENPAGRVPVKYVFLYDKHTGHFKAKEKYRSDN